MIKIYGIVNPINNDLFYIGATKNFNKRRIQHIRGCGSDSQPRKLEIDRIKLLGYEPEVIEIDYGCKLHQGVKSFYPQIIKSFYFRKGERVYVDFYNNFGTIVDQSDYFSVDIIMDGIDRVISHSVHHIKRIDEL